MTDKQTADVTIAGELAPGFEQILTPEAVAFIAELHRRFGATRDELLALRVEAPGGDRRRRRLRLPARDRCGTGR